MNLRPYQEKAVASAYSYLETQTDNPCMVLPTGAGKSWVLARIAVDVAEKWNGRCVILAHVKELLEQNAEKIRFLAGPSLKVGVYSAGLGSKQLDCPVTVAGIQSIYQQAANIGPIDLVIVDEAHLIPPGGDGRYREFLKDIKTLNPHSRVVGLTATPFRMSSGSLCGPDEILNAVCIDVPIRPLMDAGYLCKLRSKRGAATPNMDGLHVKGGEFVAGETENLMDQDVLVESACAEIAATNRKAVLIFAAGIAHGEHVARVIRSKHGAECPFITGETPAGERASIISRFRQGAIRFLCNVNVLTTGFDAPNIDCIALLRPTLSPGLYSQMVGRGFRPHASKDDCLVLDFAGNVLRHGPIDAIVIREPGDKSDREPPARVCPECEEIVGIRCAICPACGFEFPPPEEKPKHDAKAGTESILSEPQEEDPRLGEHDVKEIRYYEHRKKNDENAPPTMRVDYITIIGMKFSEWVCIEHKGYARGKAEVWWRQRSVEAIPSYVEEAVWIGQNGGIAPVTTITVAKEKDSKYERITHYAIGTKPLPIPPENFPGYEPEEETEQPTQPATFDIPDDEIPF